MNFKLTFHKLVTTKDVQVLRLSDIIHPLRASWGVSRVYSVSTCNGDRDDDVEVDFLVIQITNKMPVSRPGMVLSSMKKALLGKWYVNVNGSRKPVEIDYGPNYFACYTDGFCAEMLREQNISIPCWRNIATNNLITINDIVISKLFMCDQIELYDGEFEFVYRSVILDKLSGKVFYHADFVIVRDSRKKVVIRICIDDSVFRRNNFYVKVSRYTYLGIIFILFIYWVI